MSCTMCLASVPARQSAIPWEFGIGLLLIIRRKVMNNGLAGRARNVENVEAKRIYRERCRQPLAVRQRRSEGK